MDRQEAIQKLKELASSRDPEVAHGEADGVLLQFLRDQGFEDVADAWVHASYEVGFWYA